MGTENVFHEVKRGPKTIEYDMFRFDQFVHLIVEWVRRKLKAKLNVKCFR
ncbi:Hypothetical protein Mbur_1138 [Methanococcoides burtonii DSM 6242]|uniref:Uncharacterized protein n=1 Tax=Methanococcoides burtonii (strain DSM 6242 / NBRC 107633 / OCM 468 / ACE-M) TaxID=259564 RepID=Q12WW3_METBU|nr:Hypothetical protein Mbur_1138 [Methanococcoides burtonii DSM 6242]